jgi:hypothetical protein
MLNAYFSIFQLAHASLMPYLFVRKTLMLLGIKSERDIAAFLSVDISLLINPCYIESCVTCCFFIPDILSLRMINGYSTCKA